MTCQSYSPISKLHVELLWTIFSMNTLTDKSNDETDVAWISTRTNPENQDRPLTIIRRSSQVCRNWRAIILESPSLWGKVIDLTLLCGLARGHWMTEVIRRSGQHVLHITTDHVGVSSRLPALVVLLDDHWERIRALNVTITIRSPDETIVAEISRTLRRPTETLRSFKLELKSDSWEDSTPDLAVETPLYADYAPSLTGFHCAYSFLNLDSPGSWFSQLRILHFELRTGGYTIPAVLRTLESTPALETLTLSGAVRPGTALPKKSITLPNLKFMRLLTSRIIAVAAILDTLVVPAGCALIVFATQEENPVELFDGARVYQAFNRYSQNYFHSHNATSLLLSTSSDTFIFHDTCPTRGNDNFALNIFSDSRFTNDDWSHLFTPLMVTKFNNVIYVNFDILPPSISPDDPNLTGFISGLLSVEFMELVEPTLRFFLSTPKDIKPIIFPKLHSLIYTAEPKYPYEGSVGPLLPFLKWRSDAGVPIKEIDLRDLDFPTFVQDMDFLEEMTGLKVSWYTPDENIPYREHVCGSSNPVKSS